MRLSLDELQSCFDRLLVRLRASGLNEVDTGGHDLYWSVLADSNAS